MLGIITEYNPFHNGHKLHIEASKKATDNGKCIVVMSGNFVQRGEPAILDKYTRTEMALLNGADIVIELPLVFATASAELFALGAIDILEKTGIVKNICFGSEAGNLDQFLNIADILANEPIEFKEYLHKHLLEGLSFPKARMLALEQLLDTKLDFLNEPNNILSIEYLKAIKKIDSNIVAKTIKREKAHFHSENIDSSIASATAIRKAFLENRENDIKNTIPKSCYKIIKNNIDEKCININDYSQILSFILRTTNIEKIKNIADITEGIENKILENIDTIPIDRLIEKLKSKRYTHTKLKRALLHIILDITKEEQVDLKENLNPYIRVLGFRKSSEHILKELIDNAKVPVITNLKNANKILDERGMYYLKKEIKSTDIYYLDKNEKINIEYRKPLVIKK